MDRDPPEATTEKIALVPRTLFEVERLYSSVWLARLTPVGLLVDQRESGSVAETKEDATEPEREFSFTEKQAAKTAEEES